MLHNINNYSLRNAETKNIYDCQCWYGLQSVLNTIWIRLSFGPVRSARSSNCDNSQGCFFLLLLLLLSPDDVDDSFSWCIQFNHSLARNLPRTIFDWMIVSSRLISVNTSCLISGFSSTTPTNVMNQRTTIIDSVHHTLGDNDL